MSDEMLTVTFPVRAADLWNAVFLEDFAHYPYWTRINVKPVLWQGPGHSATAWGLMPSGEVVKAKNITVESLVAALSELVAQRRTDIDIFNVCLWTDYEADLLLQKTVFGEVIYNIRKSY